MADTMRKNTDAEATLIAYLALLWMYSQDIHTGQPWSAFAPKHNFAWEISDQHFRCCVQQQARREMKSSLAA